GIAEGGKPDKFAMRSPSNDRRWPMMRETLIQSKIGHDCRGGTLRIQLAEQSVDPFLRKSHFPSPVMKDHRGQSVLYGIKLLMVSRLSRLPASLENPHRVGDFLIRSDLQA